MIPPPDGSLKANFDVAVRSNFSVDSTIVIEEKGKVLAVCTSKLNTIEVNEEAFATSLAYRLVYLLDLKPLFLEGD
jgi:hypothetical protein